MQYIRFLEVEQERLHQQVREVATQLHTSKVANSALQRQIAGLVAGPGSGAGGRMERD